jgi:hypothetical protein
VRATCAVVAPLRVRKLLDFRDNLEVLFKSARLESGKTICTSLFVCRDVVKLSNLARRETLYERTVRDCRDFQLAARGRWMCVEKKSSSSSAAAMGRLCNSEDLA